MQLTPRKREILRRVIEEHVATGQPVGSRVLVERSGLAVSPSTVRSELAELERLELMTLRDEDFLAAARALGEEPGAEEPLAGFLRRRR